jgi:hypothetical protein
VHMDDGALVPRRPIGHHECLPVVAVHRFRFQSRRT